MRKYAYLARLEELLTVLPAEERQEALNYYEEYFDAAGSENEEKTAEELGEPTELARKILEGEGIDPEAIPTERGVSPTEEPMDRNPSRAVGESPVTPPAGPEPPVLENPAQYTTKGVPEYPSAQKHTRRRLWIIYWLLILLALAIQISALVFGLRGFSGRGKDTASMAVSDAVSKADPTEVTPIPTADAGLAAEGVVTYSGALEAPGKGTLFVNLTRGNVAFKAGDKASVEVRNVEVGNHVTYGQTVDYGYSFVCDSTDPNTHVTITLPEKAYDRVEVNIGTSGAIQLGDLRIKEIKAYTASGPIQGGWLRVGSLTAETDIGNIWLEKVSNGTGYQTEEVRLMAPNGSVGANFNATRDQWSTEITAPGGMTESTTASSNESGKKRVLHIEAANKVKIQYGVS